MTPILHDLVKHAHAIINGAFSVSVIKFLNKEFLNLFFNYSFNSLAHDKSLIKLISCSNCFLASNPRIWHISLKYLSVNSSVCSCDNFSHAGLFATNHSKFRLAFFVVDITMQFFIASCSMRVPASSGKSTPQYRSSIKLCLALSISPCFMTTDKYARIIATSLCSNFKLYSLRCCLLPHKFSAMSLR